MTVPNAGPRPTGRRFGIRWRIAAGLLLALLLVLGWAGLQAVRGAQDLRAAADTLRTLRIELTGGDLSAGALAELRTAADHAAKGRAHLDDPVLRALSVVPVLGLPLETARGLASAADLTVRTGLLPLATAAGDKPATRLIAGPGAIDLGYLVSLTGPTTAAVTALSQAQALVEATPVTSRVGALDRARATFSADLVELRSTLDNTALAMKVAPQLLGAGATRRYLLLPQTPSEARGTGGLIGGFSVLEVTEGALKIVRSGTRVELANANGPVVDLGPEFAAHYGVSGAASGWVNSNLSPHLPYAGRIWQGLWDRQFSQPLDGVIVLDPVALSYLLRVTGPVTLASGTVVSTDDVVNLTLRDVYALSDRKDVRDAFQQSVSVAVAQALTSRSLQAKPLLQALAQGVRERRLLFWSADVQVQDALADQPVSGLLPAQQRAVGDVIVDSSGSKLNYYLARDLHFTAGCPGHSSGLALTLTNGAPASGLPDYVTPAAFRQGEPPGTSRLLTSLYLPAGSVLTGLTLDGVAVEHRSGTELGLVWLDLIITLRPGQTGTLTATFTELAGSARTVADVVRIAQPLVRTETYTATGC